MLSFKQILKPFGFIKSICLFYVVLSIIFSIMLFVCPLCSFQVHSFRALLSHIRITHSNEANFHVQCGLNGCVKSYTKFSSYKAHIWRHHKDMCSSASAELRRYTSILYVCPICNETTYNTLSELTSHLREHSGSLVECPFIGCNKAFTVHSSLTAHISRNHKLSGQGIKTNYIQEEDRPDSPSQLDDSLTNSDDNYSPEEPISFEIYKRNLALCLLKLEQVYTLPASASSVQTIYSV